MPPVLAREVLKRARGHNKIFSSEVKWHNFYFPQCQGVRHKDAVFSAILTKIGDGRALEPQEIELIQSLFVSVDRAGSRCTRGGAHFLLKEVDAYNSDEGLQGVHDELVCDSYVDYKSSQESKRAQVKVAAMTQMETDNLPRVIRLVRGKPYMLTTNTDIKHGLVNGAVGMLHEIEYKEGNTNDMVRL
ncbi:hypothetical protein HPB49_004967 [Dermacentor silvarum]|uniref:Uncharacterized protein n=1 Tax=Dermacentor silvarum TaxID=543639 RepID=A0ACB8CJA8_DERSI|nr:hypothetical protein HPB49_004967 [Dermacentor silvarum]